MSFLVAKTPIAIPSAQHYAIVEFGDMEIPGTLSKPGHYERVPRYIVFDARSEWEEEIKARVGRSDIVEWFAIQASRAYVKTTLSVEIAR